MGFLRGPSSSVWVSDSAQALQGNSQRKEMLSGSLESMNTTQEDVPISESEMLFVVTTRSLRLPGT
jgi:hypothetical protein